MMLTGHEKSLPLTFFYPECEGKKTSPQVYARNVIRRQQELSDLRRQNIQQAQARQRKKFENSTRKQLVQKLTRWETTYGYFLALYHRK